MCLKMSATYQKYGKIWEVMKTGGCQLTPISDNILMIPYQTQVCAAIWSVGLSEVHALIVGVAGWTILTSINIILLSSLSFLFQSYFIIGGVVIGFWTFTCGLIGRNVWVAPAPLQPQSIKCWPLSKISSKLQLWWD